MTLMTMEVRSGVYGTFGTLCHDARPALGGVRVYQLENVLPSLQEARTHARTHALHRHDRTLPPSPLPPPSGSIPFISPTENQLQCHACVLSIQYRSTVHTNKETQTSSVKHESINRSLVIGRRMSHSCTPRLVLPSRRA
jgi:hypothetical protein